MQVLLHLASHHGGGSKMMMHLILAVIFTTLLNNVQWLNPVRGLQIISSSEYLLRSNRTGFLLVNVKKVNIHNIFYHILATKWLISHCKLQGKKIIILGSCFNTLNDILFCLLQCKKQYWFLHKTRFACKYPFNLLSSKRQFFWLWRRFVTSPDVNDAYGQFISASNPLISSWNSSASFGP